MILPFARVATWFSVIKKNDCTSVSWCFVSIRMDCRRPTVQPIEWKNQVKKYFSTQEKPKATFSFLWEGIRKTCSYECLITWSNNLRSTELFVTPIPKTHASTDFETFFGNQSTNSSKASWNLTNFVETLRSENNDLVQNATYPYYPNLLNLPKAAAVKPTIKFEPLEMNHFQIYLPRFLKPKCRNRMVKSSADLLHGAKTSYYNKTASTEPASFDKFEDIVRSIARNERLKRNRLTRSLQARCNELTIKVTMAIRIHPECQTTTPVDEIISQLDLHWTTRQERGSVQPIQSLNNFVHPQKSCFYPKIKFVKSSNRHLTQMLEQEPMHVEHKYWLVFDTKD